MAPPFQLKPVWKNEDFYIHHGVLDAESTLSGSKLGDGLIYYAGTQKVTHCVPRKMIVDQPVLSETRPGNRFLWNNGRFTEILNPGSKPVNLARVGFHFKPSAKLGSATDITAATALLLHGNWPPAFRKSVRADMGAIGLLAKPLAAGKQPSPKDILRAKLAKEDLEFKLQWLAQSSRKPEIRYLNRPAGARPGYKAVSLNVFGLGGVNFGGGGGGIGGDSEPSPKPSAPLDPIVKVTVRTKSSDGADVKDCRVYANAIAHGDDDDEVITFSTFSTPTTELIPVGRYTMWAVKNKVEGPRDTIGIGRANQRAQTVDLIAP